MQRSDEELIADCLGGQTSAFGLLVERYQNRLFHSLTHALGSREDARDVAQEAFVKAFQKLHTFRGAAGFYSWLYRVAINASVTHHRKRQRKLVSVEASRDQSGHEPADEHPASRPESSLETSERQTVIQAALAELPAEYRQVLILREMDSLSYEEIADIVDCPVGTVRSRIHRARLELRRKLEPLLSRNEL